MADDTRWKQRFDNFGRAYGHFSEVFVKRELENLSDLEKMGGIQSFEFMFELAWKLLKDYLEDQGVSLREITPKAVIKEAFAAKIIENGHIWIDMLELRNKLSHTYDEGVFMRAIPLIREKFTPAFQELYKFFQDKLDGS